MMNGQNRHGGVETLVFEGQIVGAGLNRPGSRRIALSDHLTRGLDSDYTSIRWFVGTGACANIQNGLRCPEYAGDDPCYPLIRPAKLCIVDPDGIIFRTHRALLLRATDAWRNGNKL